MKRRTFLKTLGVATSLSWLQGTLSARAQDTPKPASRSLRLLTCNIRLPLPEDDLAGHGWLVRRSLCADVIRSRRPDVICLQECKIEQLDYLKQRLPGFESFGLSDPGPVFHPANAILYSAARYQMVSAGGFWLSETPHVAGSRSWGSACVRFVNWVHLKERGSGQNLRVWNTHLDHVAQLARENQARLIVEATRPFPEGFPQILAGDLNSQATNRAIAILKEAGWIDTYAAVHGPEDPGFTVHGFHGPRYARLARSKGKGKVDWILCRGAVHALASEVIRDGRDGQYPSDHYFLSAEVALGETGSKPA